MTTGRDIALQEAKAQFEQIVAAYLASNEGVVLGKMMSSPGLKFNNKVFAFYHVGTMGFRLGKAFDPEEVGSQTARFLSPFKNKPPMKAWFIIDMEEKELWQSLADKALAFTKTL